MSTNYYATVQISTIDDKETGEFHFHIGKIGGGYHVAGNIFPSFQAIVDFLLMNETRTVITNEYGVQMSVPELIDLFLDSTPEQRRRQYDWVQEEIATNKHGQAAFLRDGEARQYYLDNLGFTISTGAFC